MSSAARSRALVNASVSADAADRLVGIASVAARGDRYQAKQFLELFVAGVPGLPAGLRTSLLESAERLDNETDVGLFERAIVEIASDLRESLRHGPDSPKTTPAPRKAAEGADDLLTDCLNAERLVWNHRDEIRLAVPSEEWLVFDGTRWRADTQRRVEQLAVVTARSYLIDAANTPDARRMDELIAHAKRSQDHSRIVAAVERAKAVPGITINRTELDKDPAQFNCANGTLSLQLPQSVNDAEPAWPEFRPHRSADFITKLSPVAYDPSARCPRWNAFMDRIMAGDTEMIAFLQRCAGYSLSGFTGEEVMFFLFGSGKNGKSTMRETLRKISGNYAAEADISTFLVPKYIGGPRPDLARLQGARMVSTTEVPAGKQLDESLVKSVTSSDMLTVRPLYKQPFEFRPQFKLWVSGNHKPQIKGTDDGIWRRILLIPFLVQIPERERDRDLAAKLELELPGILNWVVQGYRDWRECGLMPPKMVTDATLDYRRSSDVLGQFIAEICVTGDDRTASTRELFERYTAWCDDVRVHAMAMNRFGQALEERGFAAYPHGHRKTPFRRGIAPASNPAG